MDSEGVLEEAEFRLLERFGVKEEPKHPFDNVSPLPKLAFPHPNSFLPDLLHLRGYDLCSARLRAALAQPPEVAQFIPVAVEATDPRVAAMDYQVLRVIAGQPAIDIARSQVKVGRYTDRFVGGKVTDVAFVDRIALLPGLQPQTELFHASERPLTILATDTLAGRVMRAGCLGMEFEDPQHPRYTDAPPLIRTARGVERRSPATRAAHLRLVRRPRRTEPQPA